jgi:hypothetical protein
VSGPSSPDQPTTIPERMGDRQDRIASLSEYFVANADRYVPGALRQAASDAGFNPGEIEEAYSRAATRHRDELSRPIRSRARWIVIVAYGLVYLAFAIAFLTFRNRIGGGPIALVFLTIALGIALWISFAWVNRRRPSAAQLPGAMLVMLALPMVLLIAVAGLCVASTGPGAFGVF